MGHSDSIPHLLHRSFYLVRNPHGTFEHAQHSNEYRIRSFDRYMSLHHGDRSHHGAVSALLTEFGVVAMLNHLLSPLMKPIYGLPGAAALGIVTTYLSDNPAILSLAEDRGFRKYFKKYQLYGLTNLGTAFGMGLIVSTFMLGLGNIQGGSVVSAILIGNLGAIIGSVVSTRLACSCKQKKSSAQRNTSRIPLLTPPNSLQAVFAKNKVSACAF